MDSSRRNFLRLGGVGAIASLTGCTFFGGPQEYAPVIVENDHDTVHLVSVAVASPPDDGGGYTEYLSETLQVQSGESETFDQGLAFTDHAPDLFAMAVIDNETTGTTGFSLSRDVEELLFRITGSGQIRITTAVEK